MALGVIVENNAGVEQVARIEKIFHLFHHSIGLVAPLAAHERSYIAASTVFALERCIVFIDHQVDNGIYKPLKTFNLCIVAEVLIYYEVEIAFYRMSVNATVLVSVVGNELLQVRNRFRHYIQWKFYILDKARRSGRAQSSHRREYARTYFPVFRIFFRFVGEFYRMQRFKSGHGRFHSFDVDREFFRSHSLCFEQHGSSPVRQVLYERRNTVVVLHGTQGQTVEKFGTVHRQRLEFLHGPARIRYIAEIQHSTGLIRYQRQGFERHFRNERQRAFRPHHKMGYDIERVIKVHERIYGYSGGIFDAVFFLYPLVERRCGAHPVAYLYYACDKVRVRIEKVFPGLVRAGIKNRAVHQYYTCATQRLIRVFARTVHTAGVVGYYASYHCRTYRSRIRAYLYPVRLEYLVQPRTDYTGLSTYGAAFFQHFVLFPALPGQYEYGIGRCLPGKARACGAECHRKAVTVRNGYNIAHFFFIERAHHHFRYETVETGIRAVCESTQRVGENAFIVHKGFYVLYETIVWCRYHIFLF